jgi:hypothetical protein
VTVIIFLGRPAGEQIKTVVMVILTVTLDPAPVDPVPYSGRRELDPKPLIRKMPAAAVAPSVSLPQRYQPAHPFLHVFRIGEYRYVARFLQYTRVLTGGSSVTTNNQMELMAMSMGLRAKHACPSTWTSVRQAGSVCEIGVLPLLRPS